MSDLIGPLYPPRRLLLGPGPSDSHPRVLAALSLPVLGHLDPAFVPVLDQIETLLRQTYRTANPITFAVSATGMAGMECVLVNLLEPGDRVLVCVSGFFGQRLVEVSGRTGAAVSVLEQPWGQVFDPAPVREALQRLRPKVLCVVQAETSTGAWQPLEELGRLCREFDTLLVVDAVTSLGCIPLEVDGWGIDGVYSCSQKGLSCPPGLAPVSFSPRALEAINRRKTKVQSWYLDVTLLGRYWGGDRVYHHTAPISMLYALHEGLRIVAEEGLEARWQRHLRNHVALKAGLTALGFTYLADPAHQLPQLNVVALPPGVDEARARKRLLDTFGIEVGGGLGEFKGRAWRIGIMGYNSRPDVVLLFLAAVEQALLAEGAQITPGMGVAAAEHDYQHTV